MSLKTERENNLCLFHKYWDTGLASLYIPRIAKFEAVGCVIRALGNDTELCLPVDDMTKPMNHWIGGVQTCDKEAFKEAKRYDDIELNSQAAIDLYNHYQCKGVRLLSTVADDDCGIDLCTMI